MTLLGPQSVERREQGETMRWRGTWGVIFTLALVWLALGDPTHGRADEATPGSRQGEATPLGRLSAREDDPPGPLAQAVVDALPSGPYQISFFRVSVGPGSGVDIEPTPDTMLFAGESGHLSFHFDEPVSSAPAPVGASPVPVLSEEMSAEREFSLEEGASLLRPAGVGGTVRNDGQEPAVALVLVVSPSEGEETVGSPMAGEFAPFGGGEGAATGMSVRRLALGTGTDLPAGGAELVILRFQVPPGTVTRPHPHSGPELSVLETGLLAFKSGGGRPMQVSRGTISSAAPATEPTEVIIHGDEAPVYPGDSVFIPVGSISGSRVMGNEAASGVAVSIRPLEANAATPAPGTAVPGTPAS